jgi:hypothetical protein
MSDYMLISDNTVQRMSDGAFIPNDERNPDWQAFLIWAEDPQHKVDPMPIVTPSKPEPTIVDLISILIKKGILQEGDLPT